jgi:outer membrane protein TolC
MINIRRSVWTVALAATVAVLPLASGETGQSATNPPPAAAALTYAACLQAALDYADKSGLFEKGIAVSQAGVDEARSRSLPHLNAKPGARYYWDQSELRTEVSANLGEHVLEIPENVVRRKIATSDLRRSTHLSRRTRFEFVGNFTKSYLACLQAQQNLDLIRGQAEAARRTVGAWQKIASDDARIRQQKEKAQQMGAMSSNALVQAEQVYAAVRRQFISLCQVSAGDTQRFVDLPDYSLPPVTLNACLAWAEQKRSDMAAAREALALVAQAIKLARLGYLPTPILSFGYTQGDDVNIEEGPYALLALDIPLWDSGEIAAQVRKLKAQEGALRIELEALKLRIIQDVTTRYSELQKTVQDYQSGVADRAAADEWKSAEAKYRLSQISGEEYALAGLKWAEYQGRTLQKKWTCFETESRLLEAVEATAEDWIGGLRLTAERHTP